MPHLTPAPTRSDGLRADPDSGVLLARHSRIVPDPDQPRKYFLEESLQHLRTDINAWRDARRGLAQTGIGLHSVGIGLWRSQDEQE